MAADAPYLNALKGWEDDDLRLAAQQIEVLKLHPGWGALWRLVDSTRDNALSKLIGNGSAGAVLEQAEYARLVGFLAGMEQPRTAADSIEEAQRRRVARNEGE